MSNRLPAALQLDKDAHIFGIEAFRPVADEAVVHDAYEYLHGRFSEAVRPLEDADQLMLVWPEESGTALLRAGVRALGTQAVTHVMMNVTEALPPEVREPVITQTRNFSVTKNAVVRGRQLVTLRLSTDAQHHKHRNLITGLIDEQTKTPFAWPVYRALLPVAYLEDRSLADTIRGIRAARPIEVPLGPIELHRSGALQ